MLVRAVGTDDDNDDDDDDDDVMVFHTTHSMIPYRFHVS